jgi:hypothetical protein
MLQQGDAIIKLRTRSSSSLDLAVIHRDSSTENSIKKNINFAGN